MKDYKIYGNEELELEFIEGLKKSGFSIDSLFKDGVESAAKSFIDIAILTDHMMGDEDYYKNIGNLCMGLSKQYEGFYETLVENMEKQDCKNIPKRASMLLYNL